MTNLRLATLALLTSFVVSLVILFSIKTTEASPSQIVDSTNSSATAKPSQRKVIRTTYGSNSNRVFSVAYDGTNQYLYYSDNADAASPTWSSVSFANGMTAADMVWDETNNVIYLVYGFINPIDSNSSDITYKQVTDLGNTPIVGTARIALNGSVSSTTYHHPQVTIAQDSSTTKVFVFGNRSTAAGSPLGWDVAVGTINSDNPTWTTYNAKSWTAAAAAGLLGVAKTNTDKLTVFYYDGVNLLATRHDDSSSATASSGWDALDGTDNSQTTISSDDPPTRGYGSVAGMPASNVLWFAWQDSVYDLNTIRWSGTALDTEMVPVAFASDLFGPTLTTDGVTLWLIYRYNTDSTQLVYQTRSVSDGTTAWSGSVTILDDTTENVTHPSVSSRLQQGKLDVIYTTQTSFLVRHASSFKISGNVYQESASSPYEGTTVWSGCDGSTLNVAVSINGGTKQNTWCSSTDGSYYFVTTQPTGSDQDITVFLDTAGGNKAALFTHNNDTLTDITGLTLYKDRVVIRSESSSSITNADINTYDQTNDTDIPIASDGTNVTVDSGFELHLNSGETFAPGGNVTTPKIHLKGIYTGASETLTLNGSGSSSSCDDTLTNLRPFCLDSGTFTPSSNTTLFTGTTASLIQNTTYNTLRIEPGANSITHTLMAGTTTASGNLTIGNGTNTAVTVTAATNSTTLTAAGNLTISGNTTFVANASNTTSVAGNWTTSGSFTHSSGTVDFTKSSGAQTVNGGSSAFGAVTHSGAGTLQLSTSDITVSGAFSQTAGTFDTNSLNQTFQGAFSLSSGTTYTKGGTLAFAGSGSSAVSDSTAGLQDLGTIAVNGTSKTITTSTNIKLTTLTVGADDTLNISGDTLTIAGTGTPFTLTAGGTFTTTGSTVIYTGTTTATNVTTAAYNHLALTPTAATTYSLTGNLTGSNALAGNLTISTNATLDAVSGSNFNIDLAGNWNNSGSFTARSGTVAFSGADSSTQTISGTTTFNNLSASTNANSAGRALSFTGGTTTTVAGTWTITGFSGKVITLQSTDTTNWSIAPTAASVDYATISRSNTSLAICATHSTDGGNNNANWTITSGASCAPPSGSTFSLEGVNFSGINLN